MKLSIQSTKRVLLGAVILLSACSAIKLGYNNAATFTYTYLSSKVDFDDQQSARLKTSLNEIVEWHRDHELPLLARELQKAGQALAPHNGVTEPVSAEQVQGLNKVILASLRRTADHAAPVIATNMMALHPGQLPQIQAALDESNLEYRKKRLPDNQQQRTEDAIDRMAERFERWLGTLNSTQRTRIEQWAKSNANNPEINFRKRIERQGQFMHLLRLATARQIDKNSLNQQVSRLLNDWQTPDNAAERVDFELRQKAVVELVVDVLNSSSVAQRNNAAKRAASWAEDFQILAAR